MGATHIRIRALVEGFRRAGVSHVGDRIWPIDRFSAEQLAVLKAEPNLFVMELDEDGLTAPGTGDQSSSEAGADPAASGVRIRALVDGFRRAGEKHVGDRVWPIDRFSAEELAVLKAEPNLLVIETEPVETREEWAARIAAVFVRVKPADEPAMDVDQHQNSGDLPAAQPVVPAQPEPVIATAGALTVGDEAKSLPVSVISRAEPPSEAGEVTEAGPETASATETTAEPEKPASVKKPSRKKAD